MDRQKGGKRKIGSLATYCPYQAQDRLGVELTALVEDPASATVRRLAAEAHAMLAAGGARQRSGAGAGEGRSAVMLAPPVPVRLRLFCLPYAGGVSENVFARHALSAKSPSKLPVWSDKAFRQ